MLSWVLFVKQEHSKIWFYSTTYRELFEASRFCCGQFVCELLRWSSTSTKRGKFVYLWKRRQAYNEWILFFYWYSPVRSRHLKHLPISLSFRCFFFFLIRFVLISLDFCHSHISFTWSFSCLPSLFFVTLHGLSPLPHVLPISLQHVFISLFFCFAFLSRFLTLLTFIVVSISHFAGIDYRRL